MDGLSKKIYLELTPPTPEDNVSAQERICQKLALKEPVTYTCNAMLSLYMLESKWDWKATVTLVYDGNGWKVVLIEGGDTSKKHYGLGVDLGSTTVVMRLIDLNTGENIVQESTFNHQVTYGEDILTRIFACKDMPDQSRKMQIAAQDSIREVMKRLEDKTGITLENCPIMCISGNTTMIHFLLGLDAFCVFASPYALRVREPGFIPAKDLDVPICGYLYIYPSKANYLGGDIISGMVATKLPERDKISVFLDIGTNGELVVGNNQFLLAGAGAAGPALEGGVVTTGMRASKGAVEYVKINKGEFQLSVIGGGSPKGICGSGIVDLLAELLLHGWLDLRGKFVPEASDKIFKKEKNEQEEYAVEYAPGLLFFQSDVDEFVKTKAAANTMVEDMLNSIGLNMSDIDRFYVAGAFGTYINKESAVTIGLYPDMDRDRIISAGNSSLEGACDMMMDIKQLKTVDNILSNMDYVQFGDAQNFLNIMEAAMALPHTDIERYPSVIKKMQEIKEENQG